MTLFAEPTVTPHRIDPDLAQLILESAADFAVLTTDMDGVITSWNTGAELLLGWTASEAIGQHGRIIFTPEDQAAGSPEHEMKRSLADGRAEDERFHLRNDGSRFWGSGLMMPLRADEDGRARGFLKMMRDRSAQRAAEQRYATLADALPGLVFACDTDGHNVQVSAGYERFTGRTSDELLGDRWLEAVHPEDRPRAEETWREATAGGGEYSARYRFRRYDGAYHCFDCRALPERDDADRIVRWIGTCIDVEDAARARGQLEQLNRKLEQTVDARTADLQAEMAERSRAEAALRQSQKMEAIGQLTGGVAHDFNNLLTVIRSSADLLRRRDLTDERRRRYVDAIADTADRAAVLTRQLLAFARREALRPEVFDVAARLGSVTDLLRPTLGSRIEIIHDLHCDPCLVEADPNQFDTAILNLAVNARDAMDGEGRLTITVRKVDGVPAIRGHAAVIGPFLAISVADTGAGIEPGNMERIFEPFFTTKEVGKGTGLGLSQVFGFAKQSGGDVDVESRPAQGATFTLYLPCAAGEVPPEVIQTLEPVGSGSVHGRVLIVEDNDMVGEFASQLLEELGYVTRRAPSGAAALELLDKDPERFDLVLTDVVMPGMSGVELAERIRRRDPELPVVLTSGYAHVLADEGTHGFELLQKPYSVEALSRVIRRTRPTSR